MAQDLAARISDGSIAVLDLVPGEQRFHELSRFVLRGGASRFAAAVLDEEPVRYVLPVGIPGRKLDYGTLLIQKSRCALVWRTDPARPYHAKIAQLGPETTISQSPVTIRGEVWGRFDVQHPGATTMTFLVPPVTATALPSMLHRVLVEEPRSKMGHVDAAPLPTEVTEGPEPVSSPTPSGVPAAEDPPTAVIPHPLDAFQRPDRDPAASAVPAPEPDPWAPTAAAPVAPVAPTPEPRSEFAPASVDDDDAFADLYRPEERSTPAAPSAGTPGATPATAATPTPAAAASPTPVPAAPVAAAAPASQTQWAPQTRPRQAPAPTPVVYEEPEPPRSWLADTIPGFLTGLVVTLVIGGVILVAKYLGWLG